MGGWEAGQVSSSGWVDGRMCGWVDGWMDRYCLCPSQ